MQVLNIKEHQWLDLNQLSHLDEHFIDRLKTFLDESWMKKIEIFEQETSPRQQYLRIVDGRLKATNYIGSIFFENVQINVFPKVLSTKDSFTTDQLNEHLVYWLTYHYKFNFPFLNYDALFEEKTSLVDLLKIIFIKLVEETISHHPFHQYEVRENVYQTIRGRVDYKDYYRNYYSRGTFQKIPQIVNTFEFNNTFNQIIKYTLRILDSEKFTSFSDLSIRIVDNLNKLNEVDDYYFRITDVLNFKIDSKVPLHDETLTMAKLLISHAGFTEDSYGKKSYCFMFPAEKVFESFIGNFIKIHFSQYGKVFLQSTKNYTGDWYIDDTFYKNGMMLKEDIVFQKENLTYILDAKYKSIDFDNFEDQISQADINQILTYGKVRNSKNLGILYPSNEINKAEIRKVELKTKDDSNLRLIKVPFLSKNITEFESRINSIFRQYFDVNVP